MRIYLLNYMKCFYAQFEAKHLQAHLPRLALIQGHPPSLAPRAGRGTYCSIITCASVDINVLQLVVWTISELYVPT